jgi:hypothetical protein
VLYKLIRFVVSSLNRGGFLAPIATLRFKKEVIPSLANLYREPPTISTSANYRLVGLREFSLKDYFKTERTLGSQTSTKIPLPLLC